MSPQIARYCTKIRNNAGPELNLKTGDILWRKGKKNKMVGESVIEDQGE